MFYTSSWYLHGNLAQILVLVGEIWMGKLPLGKLEEKLIIDSFTQKDSKWFGKITELGFANKQNGFWQIKTLINWQTCESFEINQPPGSQENSDKPITYFVWHP